MTSSLLGGPPEVWVQPHVSTGVHAPLTLRSSPAGQVVSTVAGPLGLVHGVPVVAGLAVAVRWALGGHVGGGQHASPTLAAGEVSLRHASPGRKAFSPGRESLLALQRVALVVRPTQSALLRALVRPGPLVLGRRGVGSRGSQQTLRGASGPRAGPGRHRSLGVRHPPPCWLVGGAWHDWVRQEAASVDVLGTGSSASPGKPAAAIRALLHPVLAKAALLVETKVVGFLR